MKQIKQIKANQSQELDSETSRSPRPAQERGAVLTVRFFPYRPSACSGNIIWADRDRGSAYYRVSAFAMKGGRFPPSHPVGGTHSDVDRSQMGSGGKIDAFRERGYWASCFPEGDGITFSHEDQRSDERVMNDIRECFGWHVVRGNS